MVKDRTETIFYRKDGIIAHNLIHCLIFGGISFGFLTITLLTPEEFTFGYTHKLLIMFLRTSMQIALLLMGLYVLLIFLRTIWIDLINNKRKPALIINELGIYDNASFVRLGFIPWEEIDRVFEYDTKYSYGSWKLYRSERFVNIILKEEEAFVKKLSIIKQIQFKISKFTKGRITAIPVERIYSRTKLKEESLIEIFSKYNKNKMNTSYVKRYYEGSKSYVANDKELQYYYNTEKWLIAFGGTLLFLFGGRFLYSDSPRVGIFFMIISMMAAVTLIFMLLTRKRKPNVIMDPSGITVGRWFAREKKVRWQDIQKIYIHESLDSERNDFAGMSKKIIIRLSKLNNIVRKDNTDVIISEVQEIDKTLTQAELEDIEETIKEQTYQEIEILQMMVNIPLEELLEVIKAMHKKYTNTQF
ncbi:hypothetical protein [Alkaliphilus transvaalensis]|uniref:hypothetical protein n=1 Tax=Alkaliphilus transvaalensis TaxID=114628 RepID=UPI00047BC45E|nr:hypothetical protein [Alkaliphilus transvaalensis]